MKLKEFTNPREDWVRKREAKIVTAVLKSGEYGISHGQLSKTTNIERKNLRSYMKKLIGNGLVTRGPGLQGLYYPTTKALRPKNSGAYILSD